MRGYAVAVAVGALGVFGAGCRPTDACGETSTACGGDPLGTWVEIDVCQDPALQDTIASKQTYRNQPIVPGGQPSPELTSTDWCSGLEYFGPNGIRLFALPRDTAKVQGAYLTYGTRTDSPSDHTQGLYTTLITGSDRTSINYSASCLQRFGFVPGRCASNPQMPDPTMSFGDAFGAYGASIGGAKETSCTDSGDGGCVCSYVTESDAAGENRSGIWRQDGHVMTHFAGNKLLPTQVDYCVQGNQMTLWGHNRTNILDFDGLRTLVLRKVVCGDGFTDRGEECDPLDPDPLISTNCSSTCQKITPP